MKDLHLKTKIIIAVFTGILLALLVGLSSLVLLRSIGNEMDEVVNYQIPLIFMVNDIRNYQLKQSMAIKKISLIYSMPESRAILEKWVRDYWLENSQFYRNLKNAQTAMDDAIHQSSSMPTTSRLRKIQSFLHEIRQHHDQLERTIKRLSLILADETLRNSVERLLNQLDLDDGGFDQDIERLQREIGVLSEESITAALTHEKNGYYTIAILLVAGCVIGVFLVFFLVRSILIPLRQAIHISERIAAHDLDIHFGVVGDNELGQLLASMETMAHSLRKSRMEVTAKIEELARSNMDLQQFAYVASHDLQEPLRTVASFSQLLAERYQGKLDSAADEFIAFIVDAASQMRTLIDDLLTYSRVTTHAKPMEMVAVGEVIASVKSRLQMVIQNAHATMTHTELPTFRADKGQMVQLFQNLISNAIKFHRDQPPKVHIHASRTVGAWLFVVEDNGIGIDAKHVDRIFEVFQRLHTKDEYPGTGIGLAVCKRIVERHGGILTVTSEPGKGSAFSFTIPDPRSVNHV